MVDHHVYTSDGQLEGKVNLYFAALAAAAAFGLSALVREQGFEGNVGAIADVLVSPSILGLYELLRTAYRRWAWRKWIGPRPVTKVPDFSGTWYGTVTVMTGPEDEHPIEGFGRRSPVLCTLTISQTLDTISIQLYTARTRSHSLTAHASVSEAGISTLLFTYHALSRSPESAFPQHDGVAVLETQRPYQPVLEGSRWQRFRQRWGSARPPRHRRATATYFTGNPQQHTGALDLTWVCTERTTIDAIDVATLPVDVQAMLRDRYGAAMDAGSESTQEGAR